MIFKVYIGHSNVSPFSGFESVCSSFDTGFQPVRILENALHLRGGDPSLLHPPFGMAMEYYPFLRHVEKIQLLD